MLLLAHHWAAPRLPIDFSLSCLAPRHISLHISLYTCAQLSEFCFSRLHFGLSKAVNFLAGACLAEISRSHLAIATAPIEAASVGLKKVRLYRREHEQVPADTCHPYIHTMFGSHMRPLLATSRAVCALAAASPSSALQMLAIDVPDTANSAAASSAVPSNMLRSLHIAIAYSLTTSSLPSSLHHL